MLDAKASHTPDRGRLEFRAVSKAYGQTLALSRFSHVFEPGKVHALMGKNGSGKSTLVKILAGVVQPSEGALQVGGNPAVFNSPQNAFDAGVVTVHQELSLIPSLSIGENIFLGRLPMMRRLGVPTIDWARMHRDAAVLLHEMGLDLDTHQEVSTLSVGQQQVVEIAKAMSFKPSILLLDEPTSALASREVELLFTLVRRLREKGVTMLYITHRMNELFEIADTCTVLRDGIFAGTIAMADAMPASIVEMMFGETAQAKRPLRQVIDRSGPPVLSVEGLTRQGAFTDISFQVHPGEILGIAGLLGAGRTEVLRAIFGADPVDSGTVTVAGKTFRRPELQAMKKAGVGYTPENRKEAGLVQILSTHDNMCLASLGRIASSGIVSRAGEEPHVDRQIKDLAIKVPDRMLPVSSLSGGNQQKVVIGKWLNTAPKVMFFDEPSRGVDVQAKQQIFDIIWQKATEGLGAIFVSTELEEVLEVADRILVMRQGRIVADVDPTEVTLKDLYGLCMEDEQA
jgi:ABC-type sugar transport system ATPase subunit